MNENVFKQIIFLFIFTVLIWNVAFIFTYPAIFTFTYYRSEELKNKENTFILGNTEVFGINATTSNKYKIYSDYKIKTWYSIYLTDLSINNYNNENIEKCPENNFPRDKKITMKYTRYWATLIPVQFYTIECKT
jgi:hypothetical protein